MAGFACMLLTSPRKQLSVPEEVFALNSAADHMQNRQFQPCKPLSLIDFANLKG
jgi:hypothetical protein